MVFLLGCGARFGPIRCACVGTTHAAARAKLHEYAPTVDRTGLYIQKQILSMNIGLANVGVTVRCT